MPRETTAEKASRYLIAGRLTLQLVDASAIRARARGDGAEYLVGWDPSGWWCSCPHPRPTCCHVQALKRVTAR